MRKMSIAREIRINRIQNKNRMTGQTFNPGGHTSDSLRIREQDLVNKYKAMSKEERKETYTAFKTIDRYKRENNIFCSNSFEYNVFMRNFAWEFS